MREVLFRGKPTESVMNSEDSQDCKFDIVDGFVYGNLITDEHEPTIVGKVVDSDWDYCSMEWWCPVVKETVGQFTGLVDKNGKRIFEGDIVAKDVFQKRERIDSDGNKLQVFEINKPKIQKTAVVEYCSKRGKFDTGTPEICFDFASNFYIIGNIHDNPELLKEQK